MTLSRRSTFSSFTTLMFVSFSFVLFTFVFQQTVSAAVTQAQCEALAPGSICKKTSVGCDDLGSAKTEFTNGVCTVSGATEPYTCCKNIKPPQDTLISAATCQTFSGASCVAPAGLDTAATCTGAGKDAIGRCVAGGAFTGWCCQNRAAATAPATGTGLPNANPQASGLPNATGGQTIPFPNPLAFNTVEGILGSILGTLQGIIVVLALVFIVIGAILYITSAGNEGRMTLAKGTITAALIGLAIGIAAPSFLKEISNVLGWTATVDCAGKTGADLTACNAAQATLTAGKSLSAIALSVLNFLLSIVGVLAVIMLVIGGIMYLTSAGDEDRIDTGKKIVTYSIVGIVVALAALIIVRQIASLFA